MSFRKPRAIFEKLPAFYREHPELLEPLVELAEELLDRSVVSFGVEGPPPGAAGPGDAGQGLSLCPLGEGLEPRAATLHGPGTAGDILDWLEWRFGVAPQLWTGLEVRPGPAGWLLAQRSWQPAAVLAWQRGVLPGPLEAFDIPEDLLPVGVRVQALTLERARRRIRPRAGERLRGEVFWSRGQRQFQLAQGAAAGPASRP